MNQDENRLLIGVAAVALGVAALGIVYSRSTASNASKPDSGLSTGRIALAGYRPEGDAPRQAALQRRVRDYQSEVTAALAHQGTNPTVSSANEEYDQDDLFDLDPLDDPVADPSNTPPPAEIPNPTDFAAGNDPNPVAYSTDGPVADNGNSGGTIAPTNAPQTAGDDYGQSGTMSDTDVYRLVVNNLGEDQRQDFTRAYASMSVEQRSDLLDGFRQQIQGGN